MKGEIWKDVKDYEGLYQVSNMGRVKSLERTVRNGRGYRIVPEKISEGYDNGYGYLRVELWKDGKDKWCRINRLVAQAFIPNPDNLPEVNHKNEDKTDNRVENLEWCSKLYNINYGTGSKRSAEKRSKPVFSVNKESGLIMWWKSAKEAGRVLCINQGSITKCCKGKANSAGGHIWFYADDDDDNE